MKAFKFDYIFLISFEYFIFWLCGFIVSRSNKKESKINYWFTITILILTYSLVEGLRYARGVDYLFYKETYKLSISQSTTQELVFDWLNYGLNLFFVPYYGAFIIYSFIFIICASIFLKDYRNILHYALPFFLSATIQSSETFIRQFLSISFVFIAIKMILENRWYKFCLFCFIAISIHSSSIFIIVIIFILKIYSKPFNLYITLSLYIFFAYIFDMSNISLITPYLKILNFDENNRFQSYLNDADSWFSGNAINMIYKQNSFTKTANTLFDISLLISGNKIIKLKKNFEPLILYYNLFIIGAILFQAFFYIELMRRLALVMYLFWFIIASYATFFFPYTGEKRLLYNSCEIIIFVYTVATVIRFIFFSDVQLFVWDI